MQRVSLFLDHSDLEIYDVYRPDDPSMVAHHIIIAGIHYHSPYYFITYRSFDIIGDLLVNEDDELEFKKASTIEEYTCATRLYSNVVRRALLDRIRGEAYGHVVRVRMNSISSVPYYAVLYRRPYQVAVQRGFIEFKMYGSSRDIDPLRYECTYAKKYGHTTINIDILKYISGYMGIPVSQLNALLNVRSDATFDNVLRYNIKTTAQNKARLRCDFALRSAAELYLEATECVTHEVDVYLIPPLTELVWHYLM
jgi:hypothetical protein